MQNCDGSSLYTQLHEPQSSIDPHEAVIISARCCEHSCLEQQERELVQSRIVAVSTRPLQPERGPVWSRNCEPHVAVSISLLEQETLPKLRVRGHLHTTLSLRNAGSRNGKLVGLGPPPYNAVTPKRQLVWCGEQDSNLRWNQIPRTLPSKPTSVDCAERDNGHSSCSSVYTQLRLLSADKGSQRRPHPARA